MIPVPGHAEGTPYGARSTLWSCSKNAAGEGIHTGVDFPATIGTKVVAARPGKVVYADHGTAFGAHQLEIRCADGTRDFYAHMSARTVANGVKVGAGKQIGRVGEEGNVTGPHLHFERHKVATGPWSCAVVTDPRPSVEWQKPFQSWRWQARVKRLELRARMARKAGYPWIAKQWQAWADRIKANHS